MAFQPRTIARSTVSNDIQGQGIVLGGLGLAFGVLVWMATGGSLPFDFGPLSDAGTISVDAEASAPGLLLAAAEPALRIIIE